MIDLHCHIIPGLDDGSDSMETSLSMARMAADFGTTAIVCTPHCCTEDPALERRFREIRRAGAALQEAVTSQGIDLTLLPGMELMCSSDPTQALRSSGLLTVGGTGFLLIEFDFGESLSFMLSCADSIRDFGLVPIIAHPERYEAIQRSIAAMDIFLDRGAVIQLNKDSILGRLGNHTYQAAWEILRNGLAHVVASDAHNTRYRTAALQHVYATIAENFGEACAGLLLTENPARILRNRLPKEPTEG